MINEPLGAAAPDEAMDDMLAVLAHAAAQRLTAEEDEMVETMADLLWRGNPSR